MNNGFFTPDLASIYGSQIQESDTIENILKRVPNMKLKV